MSCVSAGKKKIIQKSSNFDSICVVPYYACWGPGSFPSPAAQSHPQSADWKQDMSLKTGLLH